MWIELSRPLLFFDLETTGTSISTDRIVDQHPQLRTRYCTILGAASELDLANTISEGSMNPGVRSLMARRPVRAAARLTTCWIAASRHSARAVTSKAVRPPS